MMSSFLAASFASLSVTHSSKFLRITVVYVLWIGHSFYNTWGLCTGICGRSCRKRFGNLARACIVAHLLCPHSCAFIFLLCFYVSTLRQGHAFWRMSWTHASTCPHLCISSSVCAALVSRYI